jgi:hypothetical protein
VNYHSYTISIHTPYLGLNQCLLQVGHGALIVSASSPLKHKMQDYLNAAIQSNHHGQRIKSNQFLLQAL